MKRKGSCLRILGWSALAVVLLIAVVALYLFWPVNPRQFSSHPNPAVDYAEAAARVAALNSQEEAQGAAFNPLCKVKLLTHGHKTARVVVLVHGITNCPNQYSQLAPRIYDLGYNVLLVPLPHHGLADRMNSDQGNLTAQELAAYADQVVDIAQGLGERVTMVGLSLGGVITAWAAEQRSDLDQAVLISPAIGFKVLPAPLTAAYMRAYQLMPDSYTWWNEKEKEAGGPDYAYPRYSVHALTQTLLLGQAVLANAKREPLRARSVVVVTNANDQAISNDLVNQLVTAWKQTSPGKISTFEFPAAMLLGHDLIDPNDKDGNIEAVYPKLIGFIQAP